jgi:hypothetical protein
MKPFGFAKNRKPLTYGSTGPRQVRRRRYELVAGDGSTYVAYLTAAEARTLRKKRAKANGRYVAKPRKAAQRKAMKPAAHPRPLVLKCARCGKSAMRGRMLCRPCAGQLEA